jgi:N6-L-threonylcarbamoyladenine synthase
MRKIILGIETSCDETSAAILLKDGKRITILSNIIGTSADMQEKYGGVIPEQAAREQLKSIIPVIKEAFHTANCKPADIDAIAVTQGPGLIGSLLVGVETAKGLATIWQKPLIPVNHLIGHFYANWISSPSNSNPATTPNSSIPTFPCLGLLVSGGHTDLVLFKDHGKYEYLGGTRDDAAGECFDKCARLIGFPYPGGPKISKIGFSGDPSSFSLPVPMRNSQDFDFSFSGLKTAFSNLVSENFKVTSLDQENAQVYWKHIVLEKTQLKNQELLLANLCASIEQTIVNSLVDKTIKAAKKHNIEQIIIAGGVAANQKLRDTLSFEIRNLKLEINLSFPPPILCTDNAAMIASAAFFQEKRVNPLELQANPNLSLAY